MCRPGLIPPAPPSFPALAQGGCWLGETCFASLPPRRGTEEGRSCCTGSWVCLPGFCLCVSKEWAVLPHTAQLGSCRASLQDRLGVGCHLHAILLTFLAKMRPQGLCPGCPSPALVLLQHLSWSSFPISLWLQSPRREPSLCPLVKHLIFS